MTIKLNSAKVILALPRAVLRAFGRVREPKGEQWVAWLPYDTPTDPVTDRRRCHITDVRLSPHWQMVQFGQLGRVPKTQYLAY